MKHTIIPSELAVKVVTTNKKGRVIKVGMTLSQVESLIGPPDDYHAKKYDPEEEDLYQDREGWLNLFGRSKKAIYLQYGLILGYYDDILTHINIEKPGEALLNEADILSIKRSALNRFMENSGFIRVKTMSSGDAFRGANLIVVFESSEENPDWVVVTDLSKEKSGFKQDEDNGLNLMNCPTRTDD